MKTLISIVTVVAALGFAGGVSADDAMAPMADDSMAMAGDAMMSPDDMLKACLEKAGMEADTMKMDEATKACHDEHNMAMESDGAMKGDAMGGDAMAPKN